MPVPAARDLPPACGQRAPRRLSCGQEEAQVGWFRSSRRTGLPRRREDVSAAGVAVLADVMAELGLVQSGALAAGAWGAAWGGVLPSAEAMLRRGCRPATSSAEERPRGEVQRNGRRTTRVAAARVTAGGTGQFPRLRRQVREQGQRGDLHEGGRWPWLSDLEPWEEQGRSLAFIPRQGEG